METPQVSKTVKLSNEELGSVQRRVNELVRRAEEGSVSLPWLMKELQRLVEGRVIPEVQYISRASPLVFERLPESKRVHSKAPWSKRLPDSLNRLDWPDRNAEHIMAELWETACLPDRSINYGRTPINQIMGELEPSHRDVQVISSTLQWLGTNAGQSFLCTFLRASQIHIG